MQLSKCLTTEPWACSSAPRWPHPGAVVDNNTHSGFLSPVCFVIYCSRGCYHYRKYRFTKIFCLLWTINDIYSFCADWKQMPRGTVPGRGPVVAEHGATWTNSKTNTQESSQPEMRDWPGLWQYCRSCTFSTWVRRVSLGWATKHFAQKRTWTTPDEE